MRLGARDRDVRRAPIASARRRTRRQDIDFERIDRALAEFRGTFAQAPPAYSAKKIAGVAAYKLARQQDARAASSRARHRDATSRSTRMIDGSGAAASSCVGGVLRAIARARSRAAPRLRGAIWKRSGGCGRARSAKRRRCPSKPSRPKGRGAARLIVPIEQLLPHVPSVVLNDRGAVRAPHGNELTPEDLTDPSAVSRPAGDGSNPGRWRLLDGGGMLLGIAESRPGGLLHPVIVLV